MNDNISINSVQYLLDNKFTVLPIEVKKQIKVLGKPTPDLPNLTQTVTSGKRTFKRIFKKDCYQTWFWLCGCDIKEALFCFPCVLFNGDPVWSENGFKDLNHLSDRCKKHEETSKHKNNCLQLALLGTANIAEQLDNAYRRKISEFNQQVRHNRYILNIIINAIRFCGVFELALRGHDESEGSSNPGIFKGLINYTAEIDSQLKAHLEKATVFKGTSKTIQNELLEIMLQVSQTKIKEEVKKSNFVSIIADDTSDVSNLCQMAVVLRYIVNGKPVERFWTFLNPPHQNATSLASCILKEMKELDLDKTPGKVIGQTYDGAAVMSGSSNGVQSIIKTQYPSAEFVHCHAHQLNLVLMKATSINPSVKIFLAQIQGICTFFSSSPQRTTFLDDIVAKRLPRSVPTRWNFQSRSIDVIYHQKNEIIQCMENILKAPEIKQSSTLTQASGYVKIMNSQEFSSWLEFFVKIMPLVEILFNQLQKVEIDASTVNQILSNFEENILKIRNSITGTTESDDADDPPVKRRRECSTELKRQAKEVCDVIICQVKERFTFTGHLTASALFLGEKIILYSTNFPDDIAKKVCQVYKLNFEKLKTELSVIYSAKEFSNISGALGLYQFLISNNLQETFSTTIKILETIVTIPMTSSEAERCFSTLKRIKTFMRNSISEERLCSLAMMSIERDFVLDIPDFNEKVIDKFAQLKQRRMDFLLK